MVLILGGKKDEEDEGEQAAEEDLNYEEIGASMEAIVKKFNEEVASLKVSQFISLLKIQREEKGLRSFLN